MKICVFCNHEVIEKAIACPHCRKGVFRSDAAQKNHLQNACYKVFEAQVLDDVLKQLSVTLDQFTYDRYIKEINHEKQTLGEITDRYRGR